MPARDRDEGMPAWVRAEGNEGYVGLNAAGKAIIEHFRLIYDRRRDLISASGLAWTGQVIGFYERGLDYGKGSADFLPSPVEGFPAIVLTVGKWSQTWMNEEFHEYKRQHQGYIHAFVDHDAFLDGGDGFSDFPQNGSPVMLWFWDSTSLSHLQKGNR